MAIKKYQASANIYNYQRRTGITQSSYLNKNGEQIANASYEISYPISIKPSTTYMWQFGGNTSHRTPTVCFYDNSDNFISGIDHPNGTYFSFDTPSNAVYLKASVYTSSANQAVLHEGSTFIDYVPYGITAIDWFYRKYGTETETFSSLPHEVIGDGTALSAWSMKGNMTQASQPTPQNPVYPQETGDKTANLLDYSDFTNTPYLTVTQITNGVNLTGTYFCTLDINLTVGTAYCMSWNEEVLSGNPYTAWRVKYTDNTYSALTRSGVAFTPTKEIDSVLFYIESSNNACSVNFTNVMLNEGSTALPYEPFGYKIPISFDSNTYTFYLNEPIRKIGDSVDTALSTGTANRTIVKYECTGQESWYIYQGGTGENEVHQFYTTDLTLNGISLDSAYSNIAPYGLTPSTRQNGDYGVYMVTSGTNIGFQMRGAKASYPDVTAWKTYLQQQYAAGTPVTVWYRRATPTTETFTAPSIPTSGSPQSFDVSTTLKPSEVSLTYHGWHEHSDEKYVGG